MICRPLLGRAWVGRVLTLVIGAGCDDGSGAGSSAPPLELLDMGLEDQSPPDAEVEDAIVDAAPPDAAVDAAPSCGAACATVDWREGPALPAISDHHTTFVHTDGDAAALFVVGGIATDPRGSASTVYGVVQRAAIDADGALGAFSPEPVALPFDLAFHGMARVDDRYYLTGGVTRSGGQVRGNSRVVMIEMGPGPNVARAVDCGEMLYGVIHPTAEVLGDALYVIGGSMGPPIARVQRARLGADGCPTDWAEAPRLPETRSHHASLVIDGRIHLLGGFGEQTQVERPTILRSTLDASGQVSGWAPFGTLDPVPWTASALLLDDTVWLIGGGEGRSVLARFTSLVRRAPLEADRIGPFEEVEAALPFERSHVHQTPVHAGRIYSAGGRIFNAEGALDSTDRTAIGALIPGE